MWAGCRRMLDKRRALGAGGGGGSTLGLFSATVVNLIKFSRAKSLARQLRPLKGRGRRSEFDYLSADKRKELARERKQVDNLRDNSKEFTAMMGSGKDVMDGNKLLCYPVNLPATGPKGRSLVGYEKAQLLQTLIRGNGMMKAARGTTSWMSVHMANVLPNELVLCKHTYPDEKLVELFFNLFGVNVTKNPKWRDAVTSTKSSPTIGRNKRHVPVEPERKGKQRDWHVVNLHRLILPAISDKHKALPPYSEFPKDLSRAPEELCVHSATCNGCRRQRWQSSATRATKQKVLAFNLDWLSTKKGGLIRGVTKEKEVARSEHKVELRQPRGVRLSQFGGSESMNFKYYTYSFGFDETGEKAIGAPDSTTVAVPQSDPQKRSREHVHRNRVHPVPQCRLAPPGLKRIASVVEDWYKADPGLIPRYDTATKTANANSIDKVKIKYNSTTNSMLVWLSCRGQSAQEHGTRTAADGDQLSDKEKRLVAALQAESLRHQKETEEKWAAMGEGSGATGPATRVYVPVKLSVRVTVHTEDKLEHTYTVYGDDALEDVVQVTRSEKFRLGKEAKRKKDAERRETRGKVTLNIHSKISQPSKPPLLPDGLSLTVPLMERSWFKQDNLRFQESTDLVIQTMLRVAAPALHEMSERNRGGCKVVNVPSGAGNFTVPWYRAFDAKTVSAITGLESMGSMLKLSQKAKAKVIEEAATPLASNAPGNRPALNLLSIPAPGEAFDDAPNEIDLLVYRPFYSPPREARYAKDYPAPADAAHVEDTTRNLIKKTRPEIILMVLEDPSRAALFHHLTLLCRGVDGTEQGPPVYVPQEVTLVDTDPYGNWFYTVWLLRRADTLPYLPPLPPKRPRTSGRTQIHVHVEGKRMNLVVGGTDRLSEDPSFTTLAVSSSSRQSDGFPSGSGLKE